MSKPKAEIGIFGGSGFYEFLKSGKEVNIMTPYGKPSDKIVISEINGHKVAFLPRHGKKHQYPPHMIPFRANVYAMHLLGVKQIIAPCAAGSLQSNVKPGDFVICDQFVDRTRGRKDTYYDGPELVHIQSVDTYCSQLRELAIKSCQKLNITYHDTATVVVIQGPRFSSKAESRWFSSMGWEVVNMTQYPENILAHELGICFVNISLITDYDAGLEGLDDIKPVTHQEVIHVFNKNNHKLKTLLLEMVRNWPKKRICNCSKSLENAKA